MLKNGNNRKAAIKMRASNILRTVRSHEAFWFYNAPGNYSGQNAMSLSDFAKMLRVVDVWSIEHHFIRGDFQRWVQFIIGDIFLSIKIKHVSQDARGENLRSDLIRVFDARISELKNA